MSLDRSIRTGADGAVLVQLRGRIDRDAGAALSDAYDEATRDAPAALDLDFSEVDYINSTGIALIVGLLARARAEKLPVRAAGLTPHYRHIFEITRLSDFIEILAPTEK